MSLTVVKAAPRLWNSLINRTEVLTLVQLWLLRKTLRYFLAGGFKIEKKGRFHTVKAAKHKRLVVKRIVILFYLEHRSHIKDFVSLS